MHALPLSHCFSKELLESVLANKPGLVNKTLPSVIGEHGMFQCQGLYTVGGGGGGHGFPSKATPAVLSCPLGTRLWVLSPLLSELWQLFLLVFFKLFHSVGPSTCVPSPHAGQGGRHYSSPKPLAVVAQKKGWPWHPLASCSPHTKGWLTDISWDRWVLVSDSA